MKEIGSMINLKALVLYLIKRKNIKEILKKENIMVKEIYIRTMENNI
jgi:hypothetical protein